MERSVETRLSLPLLISFFIHLVVGTGVILPDYHGFMREQKAARKLFEGGRDIIVNLNEDDRKVVKRSTLLSEKDSAAKGFITREKGDHYLNNSLDFKVKRGRPEMGKAAVKSATHRKADDLLIAQNTEIIISMARYDVGSVLGYEGQSDFTTIPDKNDFTPKNAIYYTNDGRFSFNTKKFKNFRYFKAMKDRIASNWFPPMLANAVISGYDPLTGTYTPGRTRIMAIPNQEVRLYFTMNRAGDVLNVVLVDSQGNRPLDASCVDAVRLSKSFGDVPDDIPGAVIIIPFVFGYYVY
ncbi:MAG TPA: TonB family protein [Spirochaetes bacterium]|nr:TonB family protein [Spirochaetota bacterium]